MRKDAESKGALGQIRNVGSLTALVLALSVAAGSFAGETTEGTRVGTLVVQRNRVFTVRAPDRRPEQPVPHDRWRVEKVDGPWLRLHAENSAVAGWASSIEVVPVEAAEAFFTRQIRDHPRDAFA
jgi:hypothetical protein